MYLLELGSRTHVILSNVDAKAEDQEIRRQSPGASSSRQRAVEQQRSTHTRQIVDVPCLACAFSALLNSCHAFRIGLERSETISAAKQPLSVFHNRGASAFRRTAERPKPDTTGYTVFSSFAEMPT